MILYTKCSNDRRPELSVRTELLARAGGRQIRKVPACQAATAHIVALEKHGRALAQLFAGTRFLVNGCTLEGVNAVFPYIQGETLERQADALLPDAYALQDFFAQYFQLLECVCDSTFENSTAFQAIFGDGARFLGERAFSVSDIDLLLGNIMVEGEKWHIIDYEWTFSFPVPFSYIRWRILHYYFVSSPMRARLYPEGFAKAFGIDENTRSAYEEMEKCFQRYVDGTHVQLRALYETISPGVLDFGKTEQALAHYTVAREEAFARADASIALSTNKQFRLYKKLLGKSGTEAALARLRPERSAEELGIRYHVDAVTYQETQLLVYGWVLDERDIPPRILLQDRNGVLPAEVISYPRFDVNAGLSVAEGTESGFIVKLPLAAIHQEHLRLEFENEQGYAAYDLVVLLSEEARATHRREQREPVYAEDNAGYDAWFHEVRATEETLVKQRKISFSYAPLLSIVVPMYNTNEKYLTELLDSLSGQSYTNIEICLADGSDEPQAGELARSYATRDKRIHYKHLAENQGISENTNAAITMAQGDFLLFVDHDDVLEKDACFEIVRALQETPRADVLYTDEDKLMMHGDVFFGPNFKPDFNPDLLRSNNYITHLFCVRKSLADMLAKRDGVYLRAAFDGAQDYDFILRCTEVAEKIVHIPRFLYHWRANAASTAEKPETKAYAFENGRKALAEHLRRVGILASAEAANSFGTYHLRYAITDEPLVSIIIPSRDMAAVLARCIDSIFQKSTYRNFEILIVENHSKEKETFTLYEHLCHTHKNIRLLQWDSPFNYAAINNYAAKEAHGEYLLFLNNDTEVISERWIEELLGPCTRAEVGACGAQLYYPDDTLQHCGIVIGIGGIAGHICEGEKRGSSYYLGRMQKTQDVSAVTGACMMVKRLAFEEAGGFEEAYAVAYNDVDFCLKLRARGYLIVYCAAAELYHHESLTRGSDAASADAEKHARQMAEAALLKERWPDVFVKGDPYFNPNLELTSARYVLAGTMPQQAAYATGKSAEGKGLQ